MFVHVRINTLSAVVVDIHLHITNLCSDMFQISVGFSTLSIKYDKSLCKLYYGNIASFQTYKNLPMQCTYCIEVQFNTIGEFS